jgi:hypothetical protein
MGAIHARASDQLTMIVDHGDRHGTPLFRSLVKHGRNRPLSFFQP